MGWRSETQVRDRGGVGGGWWEGLGKRAVAAANLSRANGSLHHFPGSQRETQKQQLCIFRERGFWFVLYSSSRTLGEVYFHFLCF